MNNNPYKKEIIGIVTLGALLLVVETWRRWDNLLSYAYLDDVLLVILALVAANYLYKQSFTGQLLWIFSCGYALCLITGSLMSAWKRIDEVDASGFPTSLVILVKLGMYFLVVLMSIRAFRLVKLHRFK